MRSDEMKSKSMIIAAIAASSMAFSFTPANAGPERDGASEVAALVNEVAPRQGTLRTPVAHTEGVSVVNAGRSSVPLDGKSPIEVAGGPEGLPIKVSLPSEVDVYEGETAADGTVVFEGRGNSADAAIQILDNDSVKLHTVLSSPKSGTTFSYSFAKGLVVEPGHDGGAYLVRPLADGESEIVAEIAPPWARDASGAAVATDYEFDGNRIIQKIYPTAEAEYPIVADPKVSYGWGIYYHFNRAETKTLAGYGLGGTTATVAGCAALGALAAGLGAIIAGATCAYAAGPFFYNAGVAENSSPKRCVYGVARGPVILSGTYRDSRCY